MIAERSWAMKRMERPARRSVEMEMLEEVPRALP